MSKNIVILGSTGSIGTQTLSVVRESGGRFRVAGLAVNSSVEALRAQVEEFRPEAAVICDPEAYAQAAGDWPYPDTALWCGMEGLIRLVQLESAGIVVTAIVGMIGLRPTVEAIRAGKDIALANKETLVCAGAYIMELARRCGVRILPVDSEHGAIFQCLQGVGEGQISGLILTASGGPFRGYTYDQLRKVTPEQALKHPSWRMGAKITIDSASMVNKGLEMIEARWLFGCKPNQIRVLVHPQSVIHSMVELVDGSVLAQLAVPDMRLPIQVALEYPERGRRVVQPLNLAAYGSLTFEEPDEEVFVSLALAREAMRLGGLYPAVLNAANEWAVREYLERRIGFTGIYDAIRRAMDFAAAKGLTSGSYELEEIWEWERRVREFLTQKRG
ncbi:MAG: 1-deoxy-D-xylulose-5-phosphate reductoisomerase [Firmicutes bacterium]|nr:1-deoxy-D-xylulose-5-phosphate reductoisomerase [Bacillota bacterium]